MTQLSNDATSTMQSFKHQIQTVVDDNLLLHSENLITMHQDRYDMLSASMAKMEQKLHEQEQRIQKQSEDMKFILSEI